jgi:transglutaminase-like putative cysteine protease
MIQPKSAMLVAILALSIILLTSCALFDPLKEIGGALRDPLDSLISEASQALDPGRDTELTPASGNQSGQGSTLEPDSDAQSPSESTESASISLPSQPDAAFDEQVVQLIRSALEKYQDKVVLDPVLSRYRFEEAQSDILIDRVYDLYEQVFRDGPQLFWLDGSARITYSILQTQQPTFSAMTLEMGFSDGFSSAAPEVLRDRQQAMLAKAGSIAALARQHAETWRQLQAVHDILIQNIVYDTSLNQANNNAASALLDNLTLCQGYAQSFQIIARELGFTVTLVTGVSDGVDHAWNLIWLDGQPYHIDVTHDDPVPDGGERGAVSHVHFLRSDSQMQMTHTWAFDDYPAAPVDGAHYYRQTNRVVSSRDELNSRVADFVASADLEDDRPDHLELLYDGDDMPDKATLEELLIQNLRQKPGLRSIVYRALTDKQIVTLELLTN